MNIDADHLHHEAVYEKLNWVWSWRGITLMHIGLCLLPSFAFCMMAWFVQETVWPDCPMALGLLPSIGAMVFVGIVQYRQAPQHLLRQLQRLGRPRHLSPLRHHRHERAIALDADQG